jgi:hypothetical protein
VGSKTFVLQRGVWTDTAFDPSRMSTVQVGFGSDGYFDLLASRPEWGDYLALGDRVIFVAEGAAGPTAYEVVAGEGESEPIEVPPTHTPEPEEPTVEPPQPDRPTPTPIGGGGATTTEPSGGLCPGAAVMGFVALVAAVVWPRMRG